MKNSILSLTCLLSLSAQAIASKPVSQAVASTPWNEQLAYTKEIAREAGKRVLEIRNSGQLTVQDVTLPNGKNVRQTNADVAASEWITDELSQKFPSYGLISQDQMDKDPNWYEREFVWLINPIDGTKEFEAGGDDFQIQIGLLAGGESAMGVSYYPATDTYVWAVQGRGAWLEREGMLERLVAAPSPREKILIQSSSHAIIESHLEKLGWIPDRVIDERSNSTSRLLKIIRGEASLYISLGASPEGVEKKGAVWNYGANAVIAQEAGVILQTLNGHPIDLREPQALLREGVLLTNDPALFQAIVDSGSFLGG